MRYNRSLAYGMFMLWGLVLSINTLFRHAHRLPNGRIVSHVHPFKWKGEKGPLPYNPHTSTELSWLDAHSNTSYLSDLPEPFVLETELAFDQSITTYYFSAFYATWQQSQNTRGPPTTCLG